MQHREQELASRAAAALKVEAAEREAEARFDAVYEAAERNQTLDGVTGTTECRAWLAARAATDEAWRRWAELMQAPEPADSTTQA